MQANACNQDPGLAWQQRMQQMSWQLAAPDPANTTTHCLVDILLYDILAILLRPARQLPVSSHKLM